MLSYFDFYKLFSYTYISYKKQICEALVKYYKLFCIDICNQQINFVFESFKFTES